MGFDRGIMLHLSIGEIGGVLDMIMIDKFRHTLACLRPSFTEASI